MFKDKIRKQDIIAIIQFCLTWPIAKLSRKKKEEIWIFSERPNEARDNGYALFKYIRKENPNFPVYYVIEKNAMDRKQVEELGNVIDFYSFKHYYFYWLAKIHISSHVDGGTPNSRVSNFMETHKILRNYKVFLQHGITKDKISFGYYNVSRADLFVCAAKPEYEFCKKEFGYPKDAVQLLGFSRFDGLGICETKKQILLMPTWRAWLANVDETEFIQSAYFKMYQSLLLNKRLQAILEENKVTLLFYPHSDMQKFVSLFHTDSSKIHICNASNYTVQQLLNESDLLLTDYSSVAFDMAYMGRPVCYYQFDYEEYRKGQHSEGYYSYEKHGFGPICLQEECIINEISDVIQNDFEVKKMYKQRQNDFFSLRDRNNCERIYKAIGDLTHARIN